MGDGGNQIFEGVPFYRVTFLFFILFFFFVIPLLFIYLFITIFFFAKCTLSSLCRMSISSIKFQNILFDPLQNSSK